MDAMKTRLAEVLAAYGADPARWPAAERDRLLVLVASDPALLAEALEIDRVLARAPLPKIPAGAVMRLMERAGRERPSPNVVPFDRARPRQQPSICRLLRLRHLPRHHEFRQFDRQR